MSEAAILDKPDLDEKAKIKVEREVARINAADKLVSVRDASRSPGQTGRTGTITLHTKNGHSMFHGRVKGEKKEAVIGLVRFISNMNRISNYSLDDDPYADARLLKIEKLIIDAERYYGETIDHLNSLLREPVRRRPIITSHGSSKPQSFELSIASGYGWKGADLLADFDQIMEYGLDAQHVARIDNHGWAKFVMPAGKMIRHLFLESAGYKWSGITRDDLRNMTPEAQNVVEERGPLTEAILSGKMKPKFRADFKVGAS